MYIYISRLQTIDNVMPVKQTMSSSWRSAVPEPFLDRSWTVPHLPAARPVAVAQGIIYLLLGARTSH